jgi:hypothetical protein
MARKQTTQSPSLDTTLVTLVPGPGDHFDFVPVPVYTGMTDNDLFTTQSEEDPIKCHVLPERAHSHS